jgi:hypothetical protein
MLIFGRFVIPRMQFNEVFGNTCCCNFDDSNNNILFYLFALYNHLKCSAFFPRASPLHFGDYKSVLFFYHLSALEYE